jgi:sulfur transfer protein SufE
MKRCEIKACHSAFWINAGSELKRTAEFRRSLDARVLVLVLADMIVIEL